MADLTAAPDWIQPGARVGCIATIPGQSNPRLSYVTVKAVGKAFVTTEPTHAGGPVNRFSLRNLERSDGTYAARYRLVDPASAEWRKLALEANERGKVNRAKNVADLWIRDGGRINLAAPTPVDVIRALLPVSGLGEAAQTAILAVLPPVERS